MDSTIWAATPGVAFFLTKIGSAVAGVGVHEEALCMSDGEFTLTHRGGSSSWQGSVAVVGFIHYHNTITIPNDEKWIVQDT